MPAHARTALLAVAALAAVAFAATRITNAAEPRTTTEQERPQREVTPAQAAATLASLQTPPGFREVKHCRFQEPGYAQKCFWTPRVLPIDGHVMAGIVTFERARPRPILSNCYRSHRLRDGLVLRHCDESLELGPALVALSADSVFVPAHRSRTPFALKTLRYWRPGTEIRMTVIGHWPHDKEPR